MKELILGYLILIGCIYFIYFISKNYTKRKRLIVWGVVIIFPLSLITAIVIGMTYNFIDSSAGYESVFVFLILVAIGFSILGSAFRNKN